MKCKQARYVISELIDGDVSPSPREQLQQHIQVCDRCRRLYRKLFALESLLDESFEPLRNFRFPDHFNRGIMDRVASRAQPLPLPSRRATRPVFVGLMAAGSMAVLLGLLLWRAGLQRSRSSLSRPIEVATKSGDVSTNEPARQTILGRRIAGTVWQVIGSLEVSSYSGSSKGAAPDLVLPGRRSYLAQWSPVHRGAHLGPGSSFRTGKASRAKVGLAEGTVIKLNANTTLSFSPDRIRLKRGEMWARVAKSKTPLLIETPRGLVKVVGTELNLKTLERSDILSVLKGRVIVRTPRMEVPCQAGEQATLLSEEEPRVSRIEDKVAVVAWTDFEEAERLYAAAQFQQAKQAYREVVRIHPENLTAQRRLFETLERTAELSIEVVSGETAKAEGDGSREVFRYSLRSQAQEDLEASLKAVGHVVNQEPDNAKAQALLGYLLIAHGQSEKALPHLKAATRIEPHPAEAHFSLAYIALNKGDEETAAAQIEEGLEREPTSPLGHTLMGITLCSKKGRFAEALQEFEQAVELDPHDAVYHANVAGMYARMGETDKALREYSVAADLTPASRYCVQKLVELYLSLGRASQAVEHLNNLATRAPDNEMVHIGLGRVYRELGEDLFAQRAFQNAIRINPQPPEPYLYLTDLCLENRRYDVAAGTMLEAQRRFPRNTAVLQECQRVVGELPADFNSPAKADLMAIVRPSQQYPLLELFHCLSGRDLTAADRQKVSAGTEAANDGKVLKAMDIAGELCQQLQLGSWVTLGPQCEAKGLRQVVSSPEVTGDGLTFAEQNIGGQSCIRTDQTSGKVFAYFNVDPISEEALRAGVYVIVEYYDSPAGGIGIQYDAKADREPYKLISGVRKFGTRNWRYQVWFLKDARFAGRQNGGADFRIATEEGRDTYLRWVGVLPVAELRK